MGTHRVLHGRYEVGELIGFGATADVHRGRDLRTGRPVAIKVLHKSLARASRVPAPGSGARPAGGRPQSSRHRLHLRRRTRRGRSDDSASSDPGPVHRDGAASRGAPCGTSSRAVRLPLAEAVGYQLGVLSALEVSHRAGVVHRDIKPANVMVTPEGAVKVVDFGIARASRDPEATLTSPGELLGTPSYLAPEQVRGETADARSDLYSAGCLLYQLLTGRPPFVGDDPVSVAYQHVHEEPVQVSTTIPALDCRPREGARQGPRRPVPGRARVQQRTPGRDEGHHEGHHRSHRSRRSHARRLLIGTPDRKPHREHRRKGTRHGIHHRREREQHPHRAVLRGPGVGPAGRPDPRVSAER